MDARTRKGMLLGGVAKNLRGCRRCPLHQSRTGSNIVMGGGNPDAPILIVTGTVSAAEDRTGNVLEENPNWPGSRTILTNALSRVGLSLDDVCAITVLKCQRPLEVGEDGKSQRAPAQRAHADQCWPFGKWQMSIINPPIVVVQGRFAAEVLFGEQKPHVAYCGSWRQFGPQRIAMATHNPAGLFGERRAHIPDYELHWRGVAERLNLLGRLWKPEAAPFQRGWTYNTSQGATAA